MGSLYPLAQPQMSIIGPYSLRVNHTSDNSIRLPGLIQAPKVSRRKVSPSHHAVLWHPVRHTYDEPAGKTVDAALGLGAIGHFGGDGGQLRALAADDAADERGEGLHVSGEVACGRSRIGLREGVADGTIAAQVVTHRRFLLLLVSGGIYDEPTFQQCPAGKKMEAI